MPEKPALPSLPSSHLSAVLGSGLSMVCLFLVVPWLTKTEPEQLLVASMGASAVLLFCVPGGDLSGPWAVLGGHGISAVVGVTAHLWIAETSLAASVAVSTSIFLMLVLRCLHPPGGATALSAVLAGTRMELGYEYVLSPVLLNVVVMLTVAYLFHRPKRRYPLSRWSFLTNS